MLEAYGAMESALKLEYSESFEIWQPKVAALLQSAESFKSNGLVEDSLWAKFYAAYFSYYPLYQSLEAIRLSNEVYEEATRLGFDRVALAAKQNLAYTLIERDEADTPEESIRKHNDAQIAFDEAIQLARELEMDFQVAWNINGKGIGYFYQDRYEDALEHYDIALELAIALEDYSFISQVVQNRALVLDRLARQDEALATLVRIAEGFDDETDPNRVMDNLSERGRILKDLNFYPDSIRVLNEALEIADSTESSNAKGRLLINLGHAYREMGFPDRAVSYYQEAKPNLDESNNGRQLLEFHRYYADSGRSTQNYELMKEHRNQQSDLATSKRNQLLLHYDLALDELANTGSPTKAQEHFQEALKLAGERNDLLLVSQIHLAVCNAAIAAQLEPDACPLDELKAHYDYLVDSAAPRFSMGARSNWAEILIANDREDEAELVLRELLHEMTFFRQNLPGVLGAWYWEERKSALDSLMMSTLTRGISDGDVSDSLLLLDQIRNLELNQVAITQHAQLDTDHLRRIISRRNKTRDSDEIESLEREYDQLRLSAGNAPRTSQQVSNEGRQDVLENIPEGASLVAYFFGPTQLYAWTATREGLDLHDLGSIKDLDNLFSEAKLIASGRLVGADETTVAPAQQYSDSTPW